MQDLSGKYFSGSPGVTGGESMCATNTISEPPAFTAPGSVSESTAGITPGTPGPAMSVVNDHLLIDDDRHKDAPDPYTLDAPSPGPWTVAPGEDVPAARGGDGPWRKV